MRRSDGIPTLRSRPRDMETSIRRTFPQPYDLRGARPREATGLVLSFTEGLDAELGKAKERAAAFKADMQSLLNFNAGPTIEPQVARVPGRHAGPGWLAKSRLRGQELRRQPRTDRI